MYIHTRIGHPSNYTPRTLYRPRPAECALAYREMLDARRTQFRKRLQTLATTAPARRKPRLRDLWARRFAGVNEPPGSDPRRSNLAKVPLPSTHVPDTNRSAIGPAR